MHDGSSHPQQVVKVIVPAFRDRFEATVVAEDLLRAAKYRIGREFLQGVLECDQGARSKFVVRIQPNDPLPVGSLNALINRLRKAAVFL